MLLKSLFKSVETQGLFSADTRIETARLTLRSKTLDDLPSDYRWASDPRLCRLNATDVTDKSYAQYALLYEYSLALPSKTNAKLAIDVDGEYVGNCVLYNIDVARQRAEYGIMIGSARHRGKGLGYEATRAFTGYVLRQTVLTELYLHTLTYNRAALQCFLKSGFKARREVRRDGYNFWFMELGETER